MEEADVVKKENYFKLEKYFSFNFHKLFEEWKKKNK